MANTLAQGMSMKRLAGLLCGVCILSCSISVYALLKCNRLATQMAVLQAKEQHRAEKLAPLEKAINETRAEMNMDVQTVESSEDAVLALFDTLMRLPNSDL